MYGTRPRSYSVGMEQRQPDTDVKAREKSALKLFAASQVCSVRAELIINSGEGKVNCLIFFIFAELGSFRFV